MTDAKAGEQCPSCNHSGGCCRGGVNECNCDAKAGELAEVGARVRGALTKARQRKDWNLPAERIDCPVCLRLMKGESE